MAKTNSSSVEDKEQKDHQQALELIILPISFKQEERYFFSVEGVINTEKETSPLQKMYNALLYGRNKVTLMHIQAMVKQNIMSEEALDRHLNHYLRRGMELTVSHLKAIAKIMIDQARNPHLKLGTQLVLLFKAIDCLRMSIPYSIEEVNPLTSYMILQILAKMPAPFVPHANREKQIFNYTLSLQKAVKNGLPSISIRNKLAQLYVEQKCFADALYQYEKILIYFLNKKPQTPKDKEKICVIYMNIAEVYQQIYTFKGGFKNGQILQNFIFRYNREAQHVVKERTPITPISGPINNVTVKNTYKDLQQISLIYFELALKFFPASKNPKRRSHILSVLGENYAVLGRHQEACTCLQDALLILSKERNAKEILDKKEHFLNLMKTSVSNIPEKNVERFRSFIVKETNKLDSDRVEWEKEEKRKNNLRTK